VKKYLTKSSSTNLPEPIDALVTQWANDPFSRGSYTYIPPSDNNAQPGIPASPLDLAEFAVPIWKESLGFAGEHTHPDRFASVHGAYESGIREAKRVGVALCIKEKMAVG